MTREEAIEILQGAIKKPNTKDGYLGQAIDMAIKALEQEPTTKNDLVTIHTEGLDEGIRCAMCTNSMKSDRGCDGSCVVDKDMYKKVMNVIESNIVVEPTTKNDSGVDCISRQVISDYVESHIQEINTGYGDLNRHTNSILRMIVDYIENMPSVTPQFSSELEKNSKKLEKDFGESDCISRADAIRVASGYCHPSNVAKELAKLPSMGRYDPYTDKFIKE